MSVFAGKYLRIDLSEKSWREEAISESEVRSWLLGSGLAAKLFFEEMDPDSRPAGSRLPPFDFQRRPHRHRCPDRGAHVLLRSLAIDRHLERSESRPLLGRRVALRWLRWSGHHRAVGADQRIFGSMASMAASNCAMLRISGAGIISRRRMHCYRKPTSGRRWLASVRRAKTW